MPVSAPAAATMAGRGRRLQPLAVTAGPGLCDAARRHDRRRPGPRHVRGRFQAPGLARGFVVGGRRILPAGWTDYSARLTPGSEAFGYGAGFWTNRGAQDAARLHRPHMPADSVFARCSLGQYVIIVPSAHLVIVGMGAARSRYEDIDGVDQLTGEAIAALREGEVVQRIDQHPPRR